MPEPPSRRFLALQGYGNRRPAGEVFDAIVDPSIIAHFWSTHGNGKLETGNGIELNPVRDRHPRGFSPPS